MKKLRFAPLIRVSTEKQERQGESLETQKKQIIKAVQDLSGVLIKERWKYSGQESASGIVERALFEQLLKDAQGADWDAVIVADASRWSRNNEHSAKGLRILKENCKRFFVMTEEQDLNDETRLLFLGMSSLFGEFQAKQGARKSIINKIERAKRGWPSSGVLPAGRTFDKKTGKWGIDKEFQKKIKRIAREYTGGVSMFNLGRKYGNSQSGLLEILTKRSGTKWTMHFKSKGLNIDETIEIPIPALLDEETIHACQNRAKMNRTIYHNKKINDYLLSRMVICDKCGQALFGQTSGGVRYYRHAADKNRTSCVTFNMPAEAIEEAVMVHLFKAVGDLAGLERAIAEATPDLGEIQELSERIIKVENELNKINQLKDKVVKAIAVDAITLEDAKTTMQGYREKEALFKSELEEIKLKLKNSSNLDHNKIEKRARNIMLMHKQWFKSLHRYQQMTYEDKRKMLQNIFDGVSDTGNRLGVYVTRNGKKVYSFRILGNFISMDNLSPLRDGEADLIMGNESFEYKQKNKKCSVVSGWSMISV